MGTLVIPEYTPREVLGTDILGRPILENTIYDPNTQRTVNGVRVWDPFKDNKIPTARFDTAAAAIMSYMPAPSGPNKDALIYNAVLTVPNSVLTYIPSVKIDYTISPKLKISGYWSRNYSLTTANDGLPSQISANVPTEFKSHTVRINLDYTLSPTMLLHLGVGMMHNDNNQFATGTNPTRDLKIPNEGIANPYIYGENSSAYGGFSPTIGAVVNARLVNIKPTANPSFNWIKGNHSFKFGAEMIVESHPSYSETFANNWFNFNAAQTADPSIPGSNMTLPAGTSVGLPFASFLVGNYVMGFTNAPSRGHLGAHSFAFYAQDSWKITPKITLEYGLRYDYQTYLKEQYGRWGNFSPTTMNPQVGLPGALIFEGSGPGHCNCDYAKIYPFAFGPRLGLAWQIAPKTVFRAGAGVSYGRTPELGYLNYTLSNFVNFNTFLQPGVAAGHLQEGIPADKRVTWPNLNAGAYPHPDILGLAGTDVPPVAIDPNAGRPPRIFQWSVGIQREITKDLMIDVSYVGNRGAYWQGNPLKDINGVTPEYLKSRYGLDVNLKADRDLLASNLFAVQSQSPAMAARFPNPFPTFDPFLNTVVQSLRPFPQFGTINYIWAPLGRTWYDSMQVKVIKRFSHNFDFSYNFTWQKELTMGAETSYNLFATIAPQVNDVFNRQSNKYISGLSRPFMNVIALSYRTPKIFRSNKILSTILADWQYSALLRYTSAQPILVPTASSNIGTILARAGGTFANRTGKPFFKVDINSHYDPNTTYVLNGGPNGAGAWTEPPDGQFGDSTAYYNDYRGRRHPTENMGIARNFPIGKEGRATLSIRAEFNNIFNRLFIPNPNSTGYGNADTQGGFGYINMGDPSVANGVRTGQIVARLTF